MAEKKSMISQIQSVGEEALGKLAGNDVARSALQRTMNLKERAEKTLTGYDEVEKRLDAIEKRLAALERPKKSSASQSPAGKAASAEVKSDAARSGAAKRDAPKGDAPGSDAAAGGAGTPESRVS